MTKRGRRVWMGVAAGLLALNLVPAAVTPPSTQLQQPYTPALPRVAIHVSELTQALETMPATPPTPTGPGSSGFEWYYTSWRYFVMHESLKEALRSDGTPFVEVSDADITAGALVNASGSPRYPILISLTTEAIRDDEISPLRDYVGAGGFVLVGSSAFTRRPDGTTRGDFALGNEMGLHTATASLFNWYQNEFFNKLIDHRLSSHIPWGNLAWHMPLTAEQIPWGTTAARSIHQKHYAWQVTSAGADVIANGSLGPLLATKRYGQGRFIYHGAMQPIIGHGGYDDGMYSYVIYRRAIEWAFEAANVPIVKLSPWRYQHDTAFMVRHDFENTPSNIQSIESSAQFERSMGVKGDYFFCTGTIRLGSEDTQLTEAQKASAISSIQRAVTLYGATIGPHNGGLPNPVNPGLPTSTYDYWHWGPDESLNTSPPGYADGKAYALSSVAASFADVEGWLTGLDNGRPGCGAAGNCPRAWTSPYFNSVREDSLDILRQANVATAGEQKCGPFPHWTVSLKTPGMRYPQLTLPTSDWYVGSEIAQALENHTISSARAAVDFYASLGALINLYGHTWSIASVPHEYIAYSLSKPRIWSTNTIEIYDWWTRRSNVVLTPSYTQSATLSVASAAISGATDPETAVEIMLPNWSSAPVSDPVVLLNGSPADPSSYRFTSYGIKVKVGTTASTVEVRYPPQELWKQTDWAGGPGQARWSNETRFDSATGVDVSNDGHLGLSLSSSGGALFSDDFTRAPAPPPSTFNWTVPPVSTGNFGQFSITAGVLNGNVSSTGHYGFAYPSAVNTTDYMVEADVKFQAGAFGGGIMGRYDTATGRHYGAWIYPDGSSGGSNVLKLIKFTGWTSWSGVPMANPPPSLGSVGTGWHHLKMTFVGNRIRVYYDNSATPIIDVTDSAPFASGFAGVNYWTQTLTSGLSLNNFVIRNIAGSVLFSDDFGPEPTDPLVPWTQQLGTWTPAGGELQGSGGSNLYAHAYYNAVWTDYSVEGRVQFPAGAYGGGIGGRVNPATGAHYGAWIFPDGSTGGSNVLKLIKYRDWTSWSGTPMQQVSLPSVGTDWHTLKMAFSGSEIRVSYDGDLVIGVTDNGFDARAPYSSGGVSVGLFTETTPYTLKADDIQVRTASTYASSGTLVSSAFDGGLGVRWNIISWDAVAGGSTSVHLHTRTADRADQLAAAAWSAPYATSGSEVSSPDKRWIQYQVDLTTSNAAVTPDLSELRLAYTPGVKLAGSNISYTGSISADSLSNAPLSAVLKDDDDTPIPGRVVEFSLDGLAAVAGVTDATGTVNVSLPLSIAPGQRDLAVTFAGDTSFLSVSTNLLFTVTSPWPVWIQDTQADFTGNAAANVDAVAVPGSVLLKSSPVGAGEEAGSFTVGGEPGWGYRRGLSIDNPNTTQLRAGHSVKLVLDTASLVGAGKLLSDGRDLRVVFEDGISRVELDRVAETQFDTSATEIWFRTPESIPAGGRDGRYAIYYDNPSAGAAPADPVNVWAFWDGFDGSGVDAGLWTQNGSVVVGGGQAHLAAGDRLDGQASHSDTLVEIRLRESGQGQASIARWGWEQAPSDAPDLIEFEEIDGGLHGLMRKDGAAPELIDVAVPDRTEWHTYTVRSWNGNAVWLVDGAPLITRSAGVPTVALHVHLNAVAAGLDVEYVRARLDAAVEPTVTLGATQPGYVSEGRMRSIAFDAGQMSTWRFLTWDANTPVGTGILLRVRTAATLNGLAASPWVDYQTSGLPISNAAGRWIQYEASLTSNGPAVSPRLDRVMAYYSHIPCTIGGGACVTGEAGVCGAGTEQCLAGTLVCVRDLQPSAEICDGLDNNCNGSVDDGYLPVGTTCGVGACSGSTGQLICVAGGLVDTCNPLAGATADTNCNGLDENCNGTADEDYIATGTTCGVGACSGQAGQLTCQGGALVDTCNPLAGAATDTNCNGLDENCNGVADDGYIATATTCGVGACSGSTGELVCSGGATYDTCNPLTGAAPDTTCNGLDENCNGVADDGYIATATTCGVGVCSGSTGELVCSGGATYDTCNPLTGAAPDTTCNGLDENCNGIADDGYIATATTCGVGACSGSTGELVCSGGSTHDTCNPLMGAAPDTTCNGLDENCNGIADDGYIATATTCGVGACSGSTGELVCSGGATHDTCNPLAGAAPDTNCNGVDENCNGTADEGYVATGTTCGVGACSGSTGELVCSGGATHDTCNPLMGAAPDTTCNGLDENCNGTADEGYVATGTTCGVGACSGSTGELVCSGGATHDTCNPLAGATADTNCNGLDENCNGTADDGYVATGTTCGVGACSGQAGQLTCQGGALVDTCNPLAGAAPDTSCNGLDENCNGTADEGYIATGTTCGVGACSGSTGELVCSGGATHDTCNPLAGATADTNCNGLDENCNGTADDGYVATGTTCGVGACSGQAGQLTCQGGALVDTCNPLAGAAPDTNCNGLDENCNGTADEGYIATGTTCGVGACSGQAGLLTCQGGALVDTCDPLAGSAPDTTCNGLDEDCDGVADDGYIPPGTSCGVGACSGNRGELRCSGGVIEDTCDPHAGATPDTTCNGIDDNCDGITDEGYVSTPTSCGLGACAGNTGELVCSGSATHDTCNPIAGASREVCDLLDNDCDGVVDDGNPGGGEECGTGDADQCLSVVEQCLGGAIVCADFNGVAPEVARDLTFLDQDTLAWTASGAASIYQLYRGLVGGSPWSFNHVCAGPALTTPMTMDTDVPAPGSAFYYLVSGTNACGEGSLGSSSAGDPRPNAQPCQ